MLPVILATDATSSDCIFLVASEIPDKHNNGAYKFAILYRYRPVKEMNPVFTSSTSRQRKSRRSRLQRKWENNGQEKLLPLGEWIENINLLDNSTISGLFSKRCKIKSQQSSRL